MREKYEYRHKVRRLFAIVITSHKEREIERDGTGQYIDNELVGHSEPDFKNGISSLPFYLT